MRWLRLYVEARNDAKLRALSAEQFRVWFNLLCLAADQEGELRGVIPAMDEELLAIEVSDGNVELLRATLVKLEKLRILVAQDDGSWAFINFLKRQYDKPSDYPERVAERVKAHRERVTKKPDGDTPSPVTRRNAVKRAYTEAEDTNTMSKETLEININNGVEEEGAKAPAAPPATAPAATPPALFSVDELSFAREFAEEAKLTAYEPTQLARMLRKYHPALNADALLLEATKAAEWIRAGPKRGKKPTTMSLRFLDNWLTNASNDTKNKSMTHLEHHNGHKNTATAKQQQQADTIATGDEWQQDWGPYADWDIAKRSAKSPGGTAATA